MRGRRTASVEVHEAAGVILDHILDGSEAPPAYHVIRRDRHSNSVDEVHLEDGRILVIKRARDPANAYRFRASLIASRLLCDAEGVETPRYEPIPSELQDEGMLVYWWVSGPTLREIWEGIDEDQRPGVVTRWGALIRRMQQARLPGYGPIVEAANDPVPLRRHLLDDIGGRLLPSIEAGWPAGEPAVRGLLEAVPDLVAVVGGKEAVLVHNDLFDQNVLCREADDAVDCVGAIDFEDAFAGPPEAELAKTEILHGPLFGQPWTWDWFPHLTAGWGASPEPLVLSFFRASQLVNMGFHAHVNGMIEHAGRVAAVARVEVEHLGSGHDHREICARASA